MFIFIHLVKNIIFMMIYQDYEAHCYQLVQSSSKGWIIVTVWYMDAIFLTKGGVRISNIFFKPHWTYQQPKKDIRSLFRP